MGKGSSGASKGGSGGGGGGGNAGAPDNTADLISNAKSFGYFSAPSGHTDETDDFFKSEDWVNGLTPSEVSAVEWYTGSNYVSCNANLRAGATEGDLSKCSNYQKGKIKNLDAALAKGELDHAVTVYRGSSADLLGGYHTVSEIQQLVGATVVDKGYTSASISKSKTFGGSIGYKIVVPPGKGRGAYVGNISSVKHEVEYLLKRGTHYKITGVTYSKKLDKPVVTMVVLD